MPKRLNSQSSYLDVDKAGYCKSRKQVKAIAELVAHDEGGCQEINRQLVLKVYGKAASLNFA